MLCLYILSLSPLTNRCVSSAVSVFNFSLPLQNQYAVRVSVTLLLSGNENLFLNNLNSVSGPTYQLGVYCGHLKASGSLWMDGGSGCGCWWSNLCSCLGQLPGKSCLCLSIQETKIFVLFLDFFFIASVWYRLRKPKVNAHQAFILSGSSCLASIELVSCGKACFADQKHNWTLYFWWHWCLASSKKLWMENLGVEINIFRLP